MHNKVKQFTYIVMLSILLGFFRYLFLENYSLIREENLPKTTSMIIDSDLENYLINLEEPEIISIDRAKKIYDQNLGIFIDSRDENDFIQGHIRGALNIPYDPDDSYDHELIDSLYKLDAPIIIYCSGEGCSLSGDLSYYLYGTKSFLSIVYFEEGFPVWKELDYPYSKQNNILKKQENDNNSNNFKINFIDYIIFLSIIIICLLQYLNRYKYFIIYISRFILGFIFIYFSYDKILDPQLFSDIVSNYDIIPFGLENTGALILPFIEFIIGACLIFGIFIDTAALVSILLLIFFIIMIAQAYLRGKSIDCGCLLSDLSEISSSEKRAYMLKRLLQDICFILYAVILKYREKFYVNND